MFYNQEEEATFYDNPPSDFYEPDIYNVYEDNPEPSTSRQLTTENSAPISNSIAETTPNFLEWNASWWNQLYLI